MSLIKHYEFEDQSITMYKEGTKYKVKSDTKVFTFNTFKEASDIFDCIVRGN